MAQHGYLREYDEAPDWNEDRDTRHDRERSWRSENERDRNFMLESPNRDWERGVDRFREDDRQYRTTHENEWSAPERRFDDRTRRPFGSSQHDHYRSWRDKQMQALDRDYDEYCREREQQFHREFDEWRRRKHGNPEPLRTGMTQTGLSSDPNAELQLTTEQQATSSGGSDPLATATLGNEGGEGR